MSPSSDRPAPGAAARLIIVKRGYHDAPPAWPQPGAGSINIDTTSRAQGWMRGLSPMIAGPCRTPDGLEARTVEQLWQFSKVYARHLEAQGMKAELTPDFHEWRAQGFAAPRAERFPMGRGARPEFSLWGEQRLGYLEARRLIYLPCYRDAVRAQAAWATLQEAWTAAQQAGRDLRLIDFDGPREPQVATPQTLRAALDDPRRPMGHAFVLAGMLLEVPEFMEAAH